MRLSIFTLFFVVIYTWASGSQEPIEPLGNDTVAISKRVTEPYNPYTEQSPHSDQPLQPPPPYLAPPPYPAQSRLPRERKFKEMEGLWKKGIKNKELATDLIKLMAPDETGKLFCALIRRREADAGTNAYEEVARLSNLQRFKGWASQRQKYWRKKTPTYVTYILMSDDKYVSWQDTGLAEEALISLRENSRRLYLEQYGDDLGIDKDDYVYKLRDGQYEAVFV